jgi:glucose/arabinose dehydrogenase
MLLASLIGGALLAPSAGAAGPPPPKASGGQKVTQVAAGLTTPTSFGFAPGKVFAGDAGSEDGKTKGGVFLLAGGKATLLPGSPPAVFGLAYSKGTLYVSSGAQLLAWSGWNGTKFAKQKVFYNPPKGFPTFNGLAISASGRLYAGVGVTDDDHGPTNHKFARDILSFKPTGGGMKIVARGIRQPWQFAFLAGSNDPFVSDLGQDGGADSKTAPDFILRVIGGQNYGFPGCTWVQLKTCANFATPWKFFQPHTDAMGLGIIGSRLYFTSFLSTTGRGPGGEVLSLPLIGGAAKPLLTGFVAPTVGLGANDKTLYVGELTGQVFKVNP